MSSFYKAIIDMVDLDIYTENDNVEVSIFPDLIIELSTVSDF